MKRHISETMRVNLPGGSVWAVLDDFGGIERYAPTIERSPILTENATGLGAMRKCEFYSGGSLIEEIIDYEGGQTMTLELSEHGMPVKSMVSTIKVTSVNAETCDISMSLDYVSKRSPLGWILGAFVLAPMMRGAFKKVMKGWVYHAATGSVVDDKIPQNEDLSLFCSSLSRPALYPGGQKTWNACSTPSNSSK